MKFTLPLQMQAYESVKAMIAANRFEHGVIYSEKKLAAELGIPRSPMRDAIQLLIQEGYLDVIPSKGFRLHEMTRRDLLDTCQIRSALEGYCIVQMAREHDSPRAQETLHTLHECLSAQEHVLASTRSIEQFALSDQQFHETIVGYLQNDTFSEIFDSFHYRMRTQTLASLAWAGRLETTLREHRAIVEQIENGSVEQSLDAALVHLAQAMRIIEQDMPSAAQDGLLP